ncbi:hypothetical protein [Pantoea pleuroti]|uniref:hypothetical protein n=1 Tax=Pantoea pleuroti TaxID=1592631 RepID=UPI0015F86034|nr:hypothetical protein [Pantoea pleuroti]MBB1226016.1 hypothetical protein [Pantoea pleuroti]
MKIENEKFVATAEFGKYLTLNGWDLTINKVGAFAIWESNEKSEYEILQPLNTSASDFSRRVIDLIEVLSKVQNKSIDKIISELNEISDDIIRIRVIHDDVKHGTIPFIDGVELFVKSKELLTSAARSLLKTQKGYYGGKAPKVVNDYFNSLKLSQTEVGSYVLKVESPIFFPNNSQDDHCVEPFGRSVSNRIIHSIIKLDEAITSFKENKNHKYFEEVVRYGVGASLCSAIIGLSGFNKNRSVEISIQPSPYADTNNLQSKSVIIYSNDIPIIEEAQGYYLDRYTIKNYNLVGKVIKLVRETDSGDGIATISEQITPSNAKKRNVECSLTELLYNQAIEAHGKSSTLDLTGNLIVSGRKILLSDIHNLKVKSKLL